MGKSQLLENLKLRVCVFIPMTTNIFEMYEADLPQRKMQIFSTRENIKTTLLYTDQQRAVASDRVN